MPGPVLVFGHDVPLSAPVLDGVAVRDITRAHHEAPAGSRIAPLLEPFLDPFVRSFLFGLESGAFSGAAAIVIWRQGASALIACRYAAELRRLGLLDPDPPLHLWNRAQSHGPAAAAFDAAQEDRILLLLAGLPRTATVDRAGPLAVLESRQAAGGIAGAEAFAHRLTARLTGAAVEVSAAREAVSTGPRLALAGAPLGGDAVHRWLDRQGTLVLDLQGPDAPGGDPAELLAARRVEVMVWQVDPHDDLHGWRAPAMRRICVQSGIRFVDLGFVPAWPKPSDLPGDLPCG